jgi:hypothetical protein
MRGSNSDASEELGVAISLGEWEAHRDVDPEAGAVHRMGDEDGYRVRRRRLADL